MKKKTLRKQGELAYVYATVLLAIGTLLCIKADLGMSMIAAPAFCLKTLFGGMMGFAEYAFQGALLLLFCLIVRLFRWQFLLSFLTALIYGGALNLLQLLTEGFRPEELWLRILLFVLGTLVTAVSIAFYLNSYLPLSVYDLFAKGVSIRYDLRFRTVKIIFDLSCLFVSIILAIIVFGMIGGRDMTSFGGIVDVLRSGGVYIGTVITALVNGILIAFFDKQINKFISFEPMFPKLRERLLLEEAFKDAKRE